MFNKVLVANRGEIAVRICQSLHKLGVESVAIYADDDRAALHVDTASEAYRLGEGSLAETYLDVEKVIGAVERTGAEAVHPGYGFLSENVEFAQALEDRGIVFVGPRPEHLRSFGLKHEARRLAESSGVALLPGSGVLDNIDEAMREANAIGYPVMLKSSAGGGGIGMERCEQEEDLKARFEAVERLARAAFGDARLFVECCIEAPRHVEVQAFGDGLGEIAILGDRDCSLQRRHQKVVEECPAPNLSDTVRRRMHDDAHALLSSVCYRSAGTVEFLYDPDRQVATFLEVNTRLQVEHGVTELVYGVDLVKWMLELAAGELPALATLTNELTPTGSAIEARVCAEDPSHDFRPTPGTLSVVEFPHRQNVRIDTWLRSGSNVSPRYDSLIAKLLAYGETREEARLRLQTAIDDTTLHGTETNLEYLNQALECNAFASAKHDTTTLSQLEYRPRTIDVLASGTQTTVQQWPGRLGLWNVGVPPSGPMDDLSFRLGNRCLGNHESAPGLEVTINGPKLAFHCSSTILIAGAVTITLESGREEKLLPAWKPIKVNRGDVLSVGEVTSGMRAYVLFEGGLDIPQFMDSASTFILGRIGGQNGRALVAGDVLKVSHKTDVSAAEQTHYHSPSPPDLNVRHLLRITMGPHCTEDFLTSTDLQTFLAAEWTAHFHSSRTGIRLLGPKPQWARENGGDAGLHPSNIHDNAYAIGAIDFTGDMPVILGPDGPSLGGFVCPGAVIEADRWKLGQLRGGDKVKLIAVTEAEARHISLDRDKALAGRSTRAFSAPEIVRRPIENPIVRERDDIKVRRASQDSLLVEIGPNHLDIGLRLKVDRLEAQIAEDRFPGIFETTAGVRSLLIRFDTKHWSAPTLVQALEPYFEEAREATLKRSSRVVHLPLSWDDPACREAIDRYVQGVRADAPWCPDNIEFIRRINGLPDQATVKDIVFNAEYLVLGLGDVYLGAPVATTVDPRHRLVTTKYNPARIWTAENSVGIGGAYLCIYGMEGPGGYQFIGRTIQVWNNYCRGNAFAKPWLLRAFDRIRFFEVKPDELRDLREAFPLGAYEIDVEDGVFDYDSHKAFIKENKDEIASFEDNRREAFSAELLDWRTRGLMTFEPTDAFDGSASKEELDFEPLVTSPLSGSIWSVHVQEGQRIKSGELLFVIESMKTEFEVKAPSNGVVDQVLVKKGQTVQAGQALAKSG